MGSFTDGMLGIVVKKKTPISFSFLTRETGGLCAETADIGNVLLMHAKATNNDHLKHKLKIKL